MLTRFLSILMLSTVIVDCTADVLSAPSLDDNKLYAMCKTQLLRSYAVVAEHKEDIPSETRQRVMSLLLAAEIDGQFKHYPLCVNKLERVQFFLKQAKPGKKKANISSGSALDIQFPQKRRNITH